MAGRPVFSGAVQVTNRLVVLSATEDTEGAAGRAGGSATSVRSIVTGDRVGAAVAVHDLDRHGVARLLLVTVLFPDLGPQLAGSS